MMSSTNMGQIGEKEERESKKTRGGEVRGSR